MQEVQRADGGYEWVSDDDLQSAADYYDRLVKDIKESVRKHTGVQPDTEE